MKDAKLFPIEVDLSRSAFQYESTNQQFQVKNKSTFPDKKKQNLDRHILSMLLTFKFTKKTFRFIEFYNIIALNMTEFYAIKFCATKK